MSEVDTQRAKLGYRLGEEEGEAFWVLGMLETITSTPMKTSGSTSSMAGSPSMSAMLGFRCRPVRSRLAPRGCPIRSSRSRPREGKPLLASNRFCSRGSSERSASHPPNVLCRHRSTLRRTWSGSSPSPRNTGWISLGLQARPPDDSATGGARSAEEEVRLDHTTLTSASGPELMENSGPSSYPYSPNLVEGSFSEVQLRDAERSIVRRVMSSSCSQPSPTKE